MLLSSKEVIAFGKDEDTEIEHLSDLSVEEAHLCHLLEQVDILSDGSGDDQTQAYNLLKSEEFEVSTSIFLILVVSLVNLIFSITTEILHCRLEAEFAYLNVPKHFVTAVL